VLRDAFKTLGISEDSAIPIAEGVEMEQLRERVILVLMQQLSSSLGPAPAYATWIHLLERCGIVTTEAIRNGPKQFDLLKKNTLHADLPDGDAGGVSLSLQARSDSVQSRFEQDFEKLELLGRGAFGEVWRCRHRLDGREYAVKVIHYQTNGGELQHRVEREARMLALLSPHPGILKYHSSWVEAGQHNHPDPLVVLPTPRSKRSNKYLEDHNMSGLDIRLNTFSGASDDGVTFQEYSDGGVPALQGRSISKARAREDESSTECDTGIYTSDGVSDGGVTFQEYSDGGIVASQVVATPRARTVKVARNSTQWSEKKIASTPESVWATLYIQTELCNKATLETWIAERNRAVTSAAVTAEECKLWAKRACNIFAECVDAVDHMHKLGCVHRDVKPSNIFFDSDGRVQLGDFGLAKMLGQFSQQPAGSDVQAPTMSLAIPKALDLHTRGLGTPSYASPEQLAGGTYGVEIDVYALGVILMELLCPVQTQMERAELMEQLRQSRRLPSLTEAAFPAVSKLALAMTHPDPKRRPTIQQIDQALLMNEVETQFGIAPCPYPAKPGALAWDQSSTCEVKLLPQCELVVPKKMFFEDDQEGPDDKIVRRMGSIVDKGTAPIVEESTQRSKDEMTSIVQGVAKQKKLYEDARKQCGGSSSKFRLDMRMLLLFIICQSTVNMGFNPSRNQTKLIQAALDGVQPEHVDDISMPNTWSHAHGFRDKVDIADVRDSFWNPEIFSDIGTSSSSSSWEIGVPPPSVHCSEEVMVDPGGVRSHSLVSGATRRLMQHQNYIMNHLLSNIFSLMP
jgi:serine/threonine protein kinase